jgi:hypothetical protein
VFSVSVSMYLCVLRSSLSLSLSLWLYLCVLRSSLCAINASYTVFVLLLQPCSFRLYIIQKINIDATTGVASYAGGLKGMPIGLPVGRQRDKSKNVPLQ